MAGAGRELCPTCGQAIPKVYNRSLTSGITATLCWLVRTYLTNGGNWIEVNGDDVPKYVIRSRETGRLKLWGLVEEMPNEAGSKKKNSGFWRPTENGIAFCYGQITLCKTIQERKGELVGYSEGYVTVLEALAERFDYRKLMGWEEGDPVVRKARKKKAKAKKVVVDTSVPPAVPGAPRPPGG